MVPPQQQPVRQSLPLSLRTAGRAGYGDSVARQSFETQRDQIATPYGRGVLDDGQRLWGDSKTWRGLLLALSVTSLAASALGLPAQIGIIIGAAAMAGDLLSSFIKRRLGMASSSMALGLDQIPESLLPLLAVAGEFGLTWTTIILIILGFVVAELALSQVLFRLGVRNRPY